MSINPRLEFLESYKFMRYDGFMAKKGKKRRKNGILKLHSDEDFLRAFMSENPDDGPGSTDQNSPGVNGTSLDTHRIFEPDPGPGTRLPERPEEEDDFEALLDRSFKQIPEKRGGRPKPMSLKKRLKRYPPVEKQLDLHGYTAQRAQAMARSFIQTHKEQGYFTLRVIVGKGRRSLMGPVLPDVVEDLALAMKKQGVILWYEWENKKKSQSGALIIYLKQFEQFD